MKFKYKFIPFETKLTQTLDLWGHSYSKKKCYILELTSQSTQKKYHGELNNFYSLHKIGLEEAKKSLESLLNRLSKNGLNADQLDLRTPGFNLWPSIIQEMNSLPISALFCLETALLAFIKEEFSEKINLPKGKVKVNGLYIPTNRSDFFTLKTEWEKLGTQTIKVKIGRDLQLERELLTLLLEDPSYENFSFRLDGNQKLSATELLYLVEGINLSRVEYFEEPLERPNEWEGPYPLIKRPLALDESLLTCKKFPTGTEYGVVKPSITHSISGTLELIKKSPLKIVISSAFETSVGLEGLIFLTQYSNETAGLDTIKYLENDYTY